MKIMNFPKYLLDEPFGALTARELCADPGLFVKGQTYRRKDIVSTLQSAFEDSGGKPVPTKQQVAAVFKSWERRGDRPFKRIARGRYEFLGYGDYDQQDSRGRVSDVPQHGTGDDDFTPEWEFGSGPYEVYAWFLPRYSDSQGRRWPIKIGRAGGDGFRRRLNDFSDNLPERPHYLLSIRCVDERELRKRESLLHAYFEVRGQKIEGLSGQEWFLTTPDEVYEAIQTIMFPNRQVSDEEGPSVEDSMAAAFGTVTDEDWNSLPRDLTDRLDHYLYGTD